MKFAKVCSSWQRVDVLVPVSLATPRELSCGWGLVCPPLATAAHSDTWEEECRPRDPLLAVLVGLGLLVRGGWHSLKATHLALTAGQPASFVSAPPQLLAWIRGSAESY